MGARHLPPDVRFEASYLKPLLGVMKLHLTSQTTKFLSGSLKKAQGLGFRAPQSSSCTSPAFCTAALEALKVPRLRNCADTARTSKASRRGTSKA